MLVHHLFWNMKLNVQTISKRGFLLLFSILRISFLFGTWCPFCPWSRERETRRKRWWIPTSPRGVEASAIFFFGLDNFCSGLLTVHELAAAARRPHRAAPEAPWAAPGLRGAQAQARGARGAQALEGCTEGAAWSESLPTFWVAVYVFLLLMIACFLLSQLLGAKAKRLAKKRYAEKAQMKKT